jgi:S-DNA-T family DNA segregation ATPase FtsK/SpoIIIE
LKWPQLNLSLELQQKAIIIGIALIIVTFMLVLSLLSPNQGQLTSFLSQGMWRLFGWGGAIIPIALGIFGFYLVLWGMEQPPKLPYLRLLGLLLLFLAFEAFASLAIVTWNDGLSNVMAAAQDGQGGGYVGGLIVRLLSLAIGHLGAVFVLLVIGIVAAILTSGVSRQDMGSFIGGLFKRKPEDDEERDILINRGTPAMTTSQSTTVVEGASGITVEAKEPAPQEQSRDGSSSRRGRREKVARRPRTTADGEQEQAVAPTPVFFNQVDSQIWTLPKLEDMLDPGSEQDIGDAYIREQVEIIEHTLESFGAPATVVEINQGPTITQYGVEPKFIVMRNGKRTKVKVGKIASLADDLALALAARSIRIQAPVPGKGYVGIEVPNSDSVLVSLRDVMESAEFQHIQSPLRIGLGQNVAGQPIATDLTQMPHLLIAGTTGSGKSVCVNSIVACLLLQNTPENLRLVMVDPKRVELTGYNGIPHLVAPVVVDLERVVGTLQWAMREMDIRYKRLADMGARNIGEFNKKAADNDGEGMPYIVIVIDELADLMMLSPEETERGITRLAQMARATGIHMVIATQRPSVDVVTGLIKANFPARIAFAVASSTDSRVILDTTGAERLLGQGDMLFQSPDAAAPLRMQGCFVSENELGTIIDYWRGARRSARATTAEEAAPQLPSTDEEQPPPEVSTLPPPTEPAQQPLWEDMREEEEKAAKYSDELLPEAIDLVRQLGKASTSLLQRRFRIGYTRAARMMDVMEEDGIIGPPTGTSKAREVLPWKAEEAIPESQEES